LSNEEYVQQKVAGGQYASVSEVIREALRLLQHQDAERE
jgi:putative addiction module CopG family antidote